MVAKAKGDERGIPKIMLQRLPFESTWPKVVGQGFAVWCPEILERTQLAVELSDGTNNLIIAKSRYQARLPGV